MNGFLQSNSKFSIPYRYNAFNHIYNLFLSHKLKLGFFEIIANNDNFISSFQGNESSKAKGGHSASSIDIQKMKSIKSDVPGNNKCVDCDSPSKFIYYLYPINF